MSRRQEEWIGNDPEGVALDKAMERSFPEKPAAPPPFKPRAALSRLRTMANGMDGSHYGEQLHDAADVLEAQLSGEVRFRKDDRVRFEAWDILTPSGSLIGSISWRHGCGGGYVVNVFDFHRRYFDVESAKEGVRKVAKLFAGMYWDSDTGKTTGGAD